MMPQKETQESIYEQENLIYEGYEGNKADTRQSYKTPSEQSLRERGAEKVYPIPHDTKNIYRLIMFGGAMVTLLLCAILFIFFLGGTGGWIAFVVAAAAIFLITVVAVDKIQ